MSIRHDTGAGTDVLIEVRETDHVRSNGPVLIIEDESGITNALALTLRHAGIDTIELSGSAGLEDALLLRPFLVILDLSLRGSDAVDVLRTLEGGGFQGAVQLISGSAGALLEHVRRVGHQRGLTMLPVLRKPFRMREIREIADRLQQAPCRIATLETAAIDPAVPERLDLGLALAQNWLEVWYQPKFKALSHEMIGAECLIRMRHPERGLVMPGAFLPGARAEDMRDLTDFVLRRACSDWPDFKAAGLPLALAVNISCSSLTDATLVSLLRSIVPQDPAWPGLILEITEDQAMNEVLAALEASIQLNLCGAYLSVDDFGLGYSGLARLRHVPFAEVKLDRSLVDGCSSDPTKAALCQAIVDLAHSLRARVVAEGIEQTADRERLEAIGCDSLQGYLLARPMPKSDLVAMIDDLHGAGGFPPPHGPAGLAFAPGCDPRCAAPLPLAIV